MMKATLVATAAMAVAVASQDPHFQAACRSHPKTGKPVSRSPRAMASNDEFGTVLTHPSGLIRIGINREGNLNWLPGDGFNAVNSTFDIRQYGLRYVDADPGHILDAGNAGAEYESTAPGCLCEGWGAGYFTAGGTFVSGGQANDYSGGYLDLSNINNLVVTPSNDFNAQNATASVQAGACLRVRHDYYPSPASRYLFEVDVTLTNVCDFGLEQVKYVRVMDWDMEPSAFNERVELNPGNAVDLECLTDDGFAWPSVEIAPNPIVAPNCAPANTNTLLPVEDNGAYFRFNFRDINSTAPLGPGASKTFKTFYGAAPTRALAVAALTAVDAEAYSFGHSNSTGSFGIEGYTSIFAFAGVGGTAVPPDDSFTAPCEACNAVHVESDGTSVTLSFEGTGPYTATCQ